jgi:flagellar hook-associated protein 3 FlgL
MSMRVASFTTTSYLTAQNMRLQSAYAEAQRQTSSGLKSETYSGIASQTRVLLNLEAQQTRIAAQLQTAATTNMAIQSMYDAVGDIGDLVDSLMSTVSAAISGTNVASDVANDATQSLEEVAALLNTDIAGRYLFGGAQVNQAPVDITGLPAATPPSTADTSYYGGDAYVQSATIADDMTLHYGVSADSPAFEQVVRAMNLLKNNPSDTAALEEAYDLLNGAVTELAAMQSKLGVQSEQVESQMDRQEALADALDQRITEIKNADLTQASVTMTQIETQLEASYASLTTLLHLSLHDYLR